MASNILIKFNNPSVAEVLVKESLLRDNSKVLNDMFDDIPTTELTFPFDEGVVTAIITCMEKIDTNVSKNIWLDCMLFADAFNCIEKIDIGWKYKSYPLDIGHLIIGDRTGWDISQIIDMLSRMQSEHLKHVICYEFSNAKGRKDYTLEHLRKLLKEVDETIIIRLINACSGWSLACLLACAYVSANYDDIDVKVDKLIQLLKLCKFLGKNDIKIILDVCGKHQRILEYTDTIVKY